MSEKKEEKTYDIAAFIVPKHRSISYMSWVYEHAVGEVVTKALKKGANVVSIRLVEADKP